MGLFSKFKARLNSNTKKPKESDVVCTKFIQFTESTTNDKEINYAFDVTKQNIRSHNPPVILNKEERKKARPQSVHLPRREDVPATHSKSLNPSRSFNDKLNIITKSESSDKNIAVIENNVSKHVEKPNKYDENAKQSKIEIKQNLQTPSVNVKDNNVDEDSIKPIPNDIKDKVDEMNNLPVITKNVKFKKISTVSSIDSDDAIHLGNQTNVKFVDTGDSSEEEQRLFPVNIVAKHDKNNVPDVYYSTNDEDDEDYDENEDDTWQQEGFSSYASNIFFSGIHDENNDDNNEMSQC